MKHKKVYKTAQKYLSSKRSPVFKGLKKTGRYTGKILKKEHPKTRGKIKLVKRRKR